MLHLIFSQEGLTRCCMCLQEGDRIYLAPKLKLTLPSKLNGGYIDICQLDEDGVQDFAKELKASKSVSWY